MDKPAVIISLDVEATGTSPATASCVMIGAVAMLDDPTKNPDEHTYVVSKRQWCIEEQAGKTRDKRCWDEFWARNMDVWNYIEQHKQPVTSVMRQFAEWYASLQAKYTGLRFVMKPASYDWQWVNALYDEYGPSDKPALPFSNVCLSTLLSHVRETHPKLSGNELNRLTKCPDFEHTHMADDDAHEQGYRYLRLRWLFTTGQLEQFR